MLTTLGVGSFGSSSDHDSELPTYILKALEPFRLPDMPLWAPTGLSEDDADFAVYQSHISWWRRFMRQGGNADILNRRPENMVRSYRTWTNAVIPALRSMRHAFKPIGPATLFVRMPNWCAERTFQCKRQYQLGRLLDGDTAPLRLLKVRIRERGPERLLPPRYVPKRRNPTSRKVPHGAILGLAELAIRLGAIRRSLLQLLAATRASEMEMEVNYIPRALQRTLLRPEHPIFNVDLRTVVHAPGPALIGPFAPQITAE